MPPKNKRTKRPKRKEKTSKGGSVDEKSEQRVSNQVPEPKSEPSSESVLATTNTVEPTNPPERFDDRLSDSNDLRGVQKAGLGNKKKVGLGAVLLAIGAVVGFFSDACGLYSKWLNRQPINVSIAWYEKKDNSLKLVPPDAVPVDLMPEDVLSRRVSIPVNLAIANKEADPLEVVRVELSYDKNLKVQSAGKAKIDPNNELIVYEHSIGTLERLGFYTPLETIDTIYVPFVFHVVPVIARSKDGVPIYLVTIVGYEGQKFADKVVQMGVRIHCKDRPTLTGVIRFHLRASVQLIGLSSVPPKMIDVTKEDISLFQRIPAGSEMLEHWKRRDAELGFLCDYNKVKYFGGIYQYILIDGVVRRVNADTDADGRLDYEMYDTTGDGVPETKAIPSTSESMLDWPENALR